MNWCITFSPRQDWRDYAGRTLVRCAADLRAPNAQVVIAERAKVRWWWWSWCQRMELEVKERMEPKGGEYDIKVSSFHLAGV